MPVRRSTERLFDLKDASGNKHRIKQITVDVQTGGSLTGTPDFWKFESTRYELDDGTEVRPNNDEEDTYTALTKPPMKLWPVKPRV